MSDSTPRVRSLDGLRGFAAVGVLLYHLSLVARPELSRATWEWLTQTPLKVLFAGTESVLVFFVLSGLVVTLPALRKGFSWRRYYPTRILRLYLPTFGAVLLAAALILLVPRDRSLMPDGSWMQSAQATSVSLWSLLSEASLTPRSYQIDNVLWSLRWEVIFSLLLPLFVWLALRMRKYAILCVALCVTASVLGRVFDVEALIYLPVFLAGAIMATRLGDLEQRPATRHQWPLALLGCLAGALLIASWLSRPLHAPDIAQNVLWGLASAGAVLVVILAVRWRAFRALLETRLAQWLGRISFSLYLAHVPILATVAYLIGSQRWWWVVLISVPASLGAAVLFQRWIEAPSHRLARATGARIPLAAAK